MLERIADADCDRKANSDDINYNATECEALQADLAKPRVMMAHDAINFKIHKNGDPLKLNPSAESETTKPTIFREMKVR